MIVMDGDQFLAPLLKEAKLWVDEIIIGVTGSNGNIKEIATDAGATVLDIPWQDDFSAARNEVQRACSSHWILSLDADEQISPNDWRVLVDFTAGSANQQQPVAVSLTTRNYLISGIHSRGKVAVPDPDPHQLAARPLSSSFVPTCKVRLFPNRKGIEYRSIFQETVESSLREACIPIVELPAVIHHLGNLTVDTRRDEFHFKMALSKTRHQPHDAVAWSELATAAIKCGDLSEALAAVDRALILNPGNPANRLCLGWLFKKNGQLDAADMQLAAVAGLGTVSDIELAEASHMRAQIAMVQRREDIVTSLLGMALRLDPANGFYLNTLGVWLLSQGKRMEARRALEKARENIPLEIDPWLNLGLLYEEAGNIEQALVHLQQAFSLCADNAKLNAAIGRVTIMLERKTQKEPCSTN